MKTRGQISATINSAFEKQNIMKTVKWVIEADDHIGSREDLALGYIIGSLKNISYHIASNKKLNEKLDKKLRKGLRDIYGKEKSSERWREMDRIIEEERTKGGRSIEVGLTEEESEDIENMLIPLIARFREKIRKEMVL